MVAAFVERPRIHQILLTTAVISLAFSLHSGQVVSAFNLPSFSLPQEHFTADQASILANGDFPVTSVTDDLLRFPQYRLSIGAYGSVPESQVVEESTSINEKIESLHLSLRSGKEQSVQVLVPINKNKLYQCKIPVLPKRNELHKTAQEALDRASAIKIAKQGNPRKRAVKLLRPLKTMCLQLTVGWWSYEFCHMKHMRQFHQPTSDQDVAAEYVLGLYVPNKSDMAMSADATGKDGYDKRQEGEGQMGDDATSLKKRYYSQNYYDGTMCDLTGKPRTAEIQFHCNGNAPDHIASVEEYGTCQYRVIIHTPRLCQDPAYSIVALPEHTITCVEVVSDAYYRLLSAQKQQEGQSQDAAPKGKGDSTSKVNKQDVQFFMLSGDAAAKALAAGQDGTGGVDIAKLLLQQAEAQGDGSMGVGGATEAITEEMREALRNAMATLEAQLEAKEKRRSEGEEADEEVEEDEE